MNSIPQMGFWAKTMRDMDSGGMPRTGCEQMSMTILEEEQPNTHSLYIHTCDEVGKQ